MEKDNDSKIFNPKRTKKLRRYLRNNMTKAEVLLWSRLKRRQLRGYKFRRQHGIKNYVIDFYCPELKLVVEADGETHYTEEGKLHDKKKDKNLNDLGILILRFTNPQIKQNLDGVIKQIALYTRKLEANNDEK